MHAANFSHLRMTAADFERVGAQPPPELRPGAVSIEMKVRYNNGTGAWRPVNAPMGKQRLVDHYHPDGTKWDKSYNQAETLDQV